MKLNRDYIVAGFTGLLVHGLPHQQYVLDQRLTKAEQKKGAQVAIKCLMIGLVDSEAGERRPDDEPAPKRVEQIQREFNFSQTQLDKWAWQVVRGLLSDDQNEQGEVEELNALLAHVMKYFILPQLFRLMKFFYIPHLSERAKGRKKFNLDGYANAFLVASAKAGDKEFENSNAIGDLIWQKCPLEHIGEKYSDDLKILFQQLGIPLSKKG